MHVSALCLFSSASIINSSFSLCCSSIHLNIFNSSASSVGASGAHGRRPFALLHIYSCRWCLSREISSITAMQKDMTWHQASRTSPPGMSCRVPACTRATLFFLSPLWFSSSLFFSSFPLLYPDLVLNPKPFVHTLCEFGTSILGAFNCYTQRGKGDQERERARVKTAKVAASASTSVREANAKPVAAAAPSQAYTYVYMYIYM